MKKIIIGIVGIFVVIVLSISLGNKKNSELIKIGVISPLTGPVAYWGESSQLGIALAQKDLIKEGINIKFIVEDGRLDPVAALSAAQKLVNIDHVDAIYSEFNPAAIAVTSFLKDKEILHLYDAAPTSPLVETPNAYKTYIDYKVSCEKTAEILKSRGIERVAVLKLNMEFGDLCLEGLRNIYPNAVSESYNMGEKDFRSILLKLKQSNPEAIYNVSYQPETLASLRTIRELGLKVTFASLTEIISPDIIDAYSDDLEGSVLFGLPNVSSDFAQRLQKEFPNQTISNYQAAALAYIHLKQMAHALNDCNKELVCVKKELDEASPDRTIAFKGFTNRIAVFDTLIQEWKDGKLVDIK